jgi:hypothetical protein
MGRTGRSDTGRDGGHYVTPHNLTLWLLDINGIELPAVLNV